ncbi:Ubox domain containing protein [Acanthamoeba castellanii str. Neff]|uniref:Ubox domain containing protein n=1 Tax=Acanthamoeba castellanii (strain ATCC 30010 / Neff) TaxID=1257118 RepID=L8GTZ4_ACACF|nr:Ubox domain containing protein [Acanthamoeba castellanii str. Neff]ELR16629.1 Ubox domain containing protein [Acanthamoeba castellanii str. Neff]
MADAMRSILEDPITLDLMEEAMVAPCGHSFSRESIERWVRDDAKHFCPLCRQALTLDQLRPNFSLRDAVEKYKVANGEPATDRRGLNITRPIAQWSVAETQEWISNFEDWVEDSVLITEHKIDGQTLARMTEEELKDKLNVTDDNVGPLMDKIAKIKNISNHLTNADRVETVVMDKKPAASTSGSSGVGDIEAGGGGAGAGDNNSRGWFGRRVDLAKESETGCCLFECERSFLCECAHGWYKGCHFKPYRPPAAIFCEHCGGKSATYARRTFWGICFIPFVMIILFLLFLEAAFWFMVAALSIFVLLCVCAVAIGANS